MDATQSDQAGPGASNSDVLKNDETVENESTDSEKIESDSDQILVPFSTTQSKHSDAAGKCSIAGPSANRNER
jgi:hypothetical protein